MILQCILQEGRMSCNLMGNCNMGHMLDTLCCSHVRRHMLLDLVERKEETLEMAKT
jgi:hypothetical protein